MKNIILIAAVLAVSVSAYSQDKSMNVQTKNEQKMETSNKR